MSDSEYEVLPAPSTLTMTKKATGRKFKANTECEKRSRTPSKRDAILQKKAKTHDIFGLSQGAREDSEKGLVSFFVNKVANGNERRTACFNGDYVLDLKIYNTVDVNNTEPKDIWRKALVRVKLQTSDDAEQWKLLQKLITSIDRVFLEEPQFFSDK